MKFLLTSKHRWPLRFSLRALLLLFLLICCGTGWFASKTRFYLQQQSAVLTVRELGGHATYESEASRDPPMPPALLTRIIGDAVMSDVVKVSLHAPRAVDGDIDDLSCLKKTRDLRLNARGLTDDGICWIPKLNDLRRLDLWCPNVTDQAMPYLADLTELRQLDLYSTQISDDGLEHLRGLKNLTDLNVRDTNVTIQGAASLQRALPNCKIRGVSN